MFNGLFDTLFNRKPPVPDAFARLFLETLQARGYTEPLTYRPDEFRLVGASGRTIHLHNAYHAYT
jgi:hypothetical protein